jgi:hypothetical protein
MRKFTYEEVKNFVESRNCVLLSNEYISNAKKLEIIFSCGHKGERTFAEFKVSEPICFRCSGHGLFSIGEIKNEILKNGLTWIRGKHSNDYSLIEFSDKKGYKYAIPFQHFRGNIKNGSGFSRFESSNPYFIYNIGLWLKVNSPNLFLVDKRKQFKAKDNVEFQDSDGYKYFSSFDNVKTSLGKIKAVRKNNIFSAYNISIWLKSVKSSLVMIDNQVYKGRTNDLFFSCKKCREENFPIPWMNLYDSGGNCPFCTSKRCGKNNNLAVLFPQLLKEWDYENNEFLPESFLPHSNSWANWKCSKCGYKWGCIIANRTGIIKCGCPKCASSKGERKIENFLLEYDIPYTPQFSFPDCKYEQKLKFDFCVFRDFSKEEILFLCEFDGEFHEKPDRRSGDSFLRLEKTKMRDEIKNKYCKKNKIKLVRIHHSKFNEIEEILKNELNL